MAGLSFELLRFAAERVSPKVTLLELEGRFHAGERLTLGCPTLIVEHDGDPLELEAVDARTRSLDAEALATVDGTLWRASFAAPAATVEPGAGYALGVGHLLVELPAPDRHSGDDAIAERHVRWAREGNALRHRAEAARAAAEEAAVRAEDDHRARELAQAEAAEARAALEELSARVRAAEEERSHELAAVHEQHALELAAAQARHDDELTAAREQHDRELAAAHEQHIRELTATQEQHAQARRTIRSLRAEVEASRRDSERRTISPRRNDQTPTATASARDEDRPTAVAVSSPATGEAPTTSADAVSHAVRVLGSGAQRARRHDDESSPSEPLPGTAAIGARHIEPGVTRVTAAAWLARGLALAAFAAVVLALILVLKPG